jgi:hypothetical protein
MPDIVKVTPTQQKEWNLAQALREFLPRELVWENVGGYPVLYHKVLIGPIRCAAFLIGDKKIVIENRGWKSAITEAVNKYEDRTHAKIEVKLGC